jgi:hypothetical protein
VVVGLPVVVVVGAAVVVVAKKSLELYDSQTRGSTTPIISPWP